MAKLPKSIIKKYGISKKAWAVFRGQKTTNNNRGLKKMAKRKRSGKRSSGGADSNLMTVMLCAGAYGAFRPKIEAVVSPYTQKLPLGNYADEVVLGTAGYLLAKGKLPFLKGKIARNTGKAILIIESARVGSGISQNFM